MDSGSTKKERPLKKGTKEGESAQREIRPEVLEIVYRLYCYSLERSKEVWGKDAGTRFGLVLVVVIDSGKFGDCI